MKTKTLLLPILVLSLLALGCKSTAPGHRTLVVRAEQAREIAVAAIDSYLKFEYENWPKLQQKSVKFKQVADFLRKQTPPTVSRLNNAIDMYKNRPESFNEELVTKTQKELEQLATLATKTSTEAKQ